MEWSWFKQCLSAWNTLSREDIKGMDLFAESHPYQANVRFAKAAGTPNNDPTDLTWHLPDRSVLFHHLQAPHGVTGERGPQAEMESIPALSKKVTSILGRTVSPEPRTRKKPLPVYARAIPAALPAAAEAMVAVVTIPSSMEAPVRSHPVRIVQESSTPVNMSEPVEKNPGTRMERPPVMERFDRQLAERPDAPPTGNDPAERTGFLQWLHRLSGASLPRAIGSPTPQTDRSQAEVSRLPVSFPNELEPRKEGKKKKKKKKKTKELVKASVRKNEQVATETLARLLALQGHDGEAIAMYERLQLLHPEKRDTFAAQIENIKSKRRDP